MFTNTEKLIAIRNLRPKRKQGFLKVISLFSFLGIMLGVAILIIVMSVMNGFRTELTNKIIGLNPHIVIKTNEKSIDDIKDIIKNKFENFKFSKIISGEGIVLSQNQAKGVFVKGIDRDDDVYSPLEKQLIKGSLQDFNKGGVIIGGELAFNLNLSIGDKINLVSSNFVSTPFGSIPAQDSYNIVGIFNSGFYEFDQNLIYITLDDANYIFNNIDKEMELEIYTFDPYNADKYKNKISLLNDSIYIYSWTDLNKSFFSALKVERNVMFIILSLIVVVATFNIISGLTILIKNKTKEIAIMKTLGLSNTSIKKSFFLTGFTIGLFATISGTIIGVVFSHYIENIRNFLSMVFKINIFPSDVYFLEKMPSQIDFMSVFFIFLLSLLITSIASYFPATSISKMNTTHALKYE